jgi:hypothetical protein
MIRRRRVKSADQAIEFIPESAAEYAAIFYEQTFILMQSFLPFREVGHFLYLVATYFESAPYISVLFLDRRQCSIGKPF